jgi:hypothetical protein
MVNARTATASDFDKAAESSARAFWVAAIIAVALWWFAGLWYAAVPGLAALFFGFQVVSAGRAAAKLRAGLYRIPNTNNGAPDGDASNYQHPTDG